MAISELPIRSHDIFICLKDVEPWKWTIDDERSIRQCSERLAVNVGKERRSLRIDVDNEEEAEALANIIQDIPGSNTRKPLASMKDQPDHTKLLHLAIALWKFDCSISTRIERLAFSVLGESVTIPKTKPSVRWMFMALVFRWKLQFVDYSMDVLVRDDPSMDNEDMKVLPEQFRQLVYRERKRIVSEVYRYIKNSYVSLVQTCNSSDTNIKKIPLYLSEEQLNLTEDNPQALQLISADRLLKRFEEALKSEDIVESPIQESKQTEGGRAKYGKGGSFGAMFRQWIRELREDMKKANDDRQSLKSNGSIENPEWKPIFVELEKETAEWRKEHLNPKICIDPEFREKRALHIQESSFKDNLQMEGGQISDQHIKFVNSQQDAGSSKNMSPVPLRVKTLIDPRGTSTTTESDFDSEVGNLHDTSTTGSIYSVR